MYAIAMLRIPMYILYNTDIGYINMISTHWLFMLCYWQEVVVSKFAYSLLDKKTLHSSYKAYKSEQLHWIIIAMSLVLYLLMGYHPVDLTMYSFKFITFHIAVLPCHWNTYKYVLVSIKILKFPCFWFGILYTV